MANGIDIWGYLSNAWDTFRDKGLFEAIWEGYERIFKNLQIELFKSNLAKSINEITPGSQSYWGSLKLNDDNKIDDDTSQYPKYTISEDVGFYFESLQDGIDIFTESYAIDVDYTLDGTTTLTWISSRPVPDDIWLWAPAFKSYSTVISDTFGDTLDVGGEIDSDEYLSLIRGLNISYWMGPEIRHIRNGLNIILRGQYIQSKGVVSLVSDTEMHVNLDSGGQDIYTKYDSESFVWEVGDRVNRFDIVINTVEVLDYIKDPAWWDRYGVGTLDNISGYIVLSSDDSSKLNYISSKFIWGVKVDGTLMSSMDSSTQDSMVSFIRNINPSYTHHRIIIYNEFWGDDGDDFSFTDEWEDYPDGINIEKKFDPTQTITFNEVSNLVYSDYENNNLGYDEYHSESNAAYDLDNESIFFDDSLMIVKDP